MSDEINWCGREDLVYGLCDMVSYDAAVLLSQYEEVDLNAKAFTVTNATSNIIVKIYREGNEEKAFFNSEQLAELLIERLFKNIWKYSFFALLAFNLIKLFF